MKTGYKDKNNNEIMVGHRLSIETLGRGGDSITSFYAGEVYYSDEHEDFCVGYGFVKDFENHATIIE